MDCVFVRGEEDEGCLCFILEVDIFGNISVVMVKFV